MNSIHSQTLRLFLLLVSLSLWGWATTSSQELYTVTDLGTLGGSGTAAYGINSLNQVVGYSFLPSDTAYHAFLWENGSMIDLGSLGGTASAGYGINNSGQVVGFSYLTGGTTYHACLWGNGSIEDLGTLGGSNSLALGINASTRIVGISYFPNFPVDSARAFFWEDGTMIDLGTLGGASSYGFAISPFSSWMVGSSYLLDGTSHACIWENGKITDLGTLGGTNSNAYGINTSNQVVGQTNVMDGTTHAFISEGGGMSDLGTLGGTSAVAYGINVSGQVVGFSTPPNNQPRAFIWEKGVMTDLNSVIDPDSGWILGEARAINDDGAIVGNGMRNAQSRAFLLTLITSDVHEPGDYSMPKEYSLAQNYPNPFNPTTVIEYGLPTAASVALKIYDILGREVISLVEGPQTAGYHQITVEGRNLSSGVYFYRLTAGSFTNTKRLVVLK